MTCITFFGCYFFFATVFRPDGTFLRSRYRDVNITVTMPEGTDVCDIGTLTVWCEPFRAIFTRIEIPRSIFVSKANKFICSVWCAS